LDNKGWKKAYIIYPNGSSGFKFSICTILSWVSPGSQIIVPERSEEMSTAEVVSIGSVLASLALLIVTAFK
jgi:hypothetical protein